MMNHFLFRRLVVVIVVLAISALFPFQIIAQEGPTENLLATYDGEAEGGFSYRWVAYLVWPEGEGDELYVDLNGERLGPYSNLSPNFTFSPNGEHIAFAAMKNDKWYIVLDGEEKWEHDGFGWAWYAWSTNLDGTGFRPQSQAVIMKFSPDGEKLAYMVSLGEAEWAIAENGKLGPVYPSISVQLDFVNNVLTYIAWPETGAVRIYGDQVMGPYDEIYNPHLSQNGDHYAFTALKDEKKSLIVDGVKLDMPGDVADFVIGNQGEIAYSYYAGDKQKVNFNNTDLPEEYDSTAWFSLSPDGQHIAFWAQQGEEWFVQTDQQQYPGFGGPVYYTAGDQNFTIMWSPESDHVAYYVQDSGNIITVLDGEKLPAGVGAFPKDRVGGGMFTEYYDDEGNTTGYEYSSSLLIDPQAMVLCLVNRETSACDPATAQFINGRVTSVQESDDGTYLLMDQEKIGPYQSASGVLVSPNEEHFAFVVETEQGKQVVLDGTLMDETYDEIYVAKFVNDGLFGFLGLREGDLYGVQYPF